jgi:methylaspartate mutase epsilon subunit
MTLDELAHRQSSLPHRLSAGALLEFIAATEQTAVHATSSPGKAISVMDVSKTLKNAGASIISIHKTQLQKQSKPEHSVEFDDIVERVGLPFGFISSKLDPRVDFECALASGFSYSTSGVFAAIHEHAMVDSLDVLRNQTYQFRIIGALAQEGSNVVAEALGGSYDLHLPPALSITMSLLEAMLAVGFGARTVVLRYSAMGNLVQDVAALRVLREEASEVLAEFADDVTVYVSSASWPGELPVHLGEAYAVLSVGAMAAGLGRADLGSVGRLRGDHSDELPDNAAAVQAERQLLDILEGQRLEDSEQLSREVVDLKSTVKAILGKVRSDASAPLHEQILASVERGLLPVKADAERPLIARDAAGAVRWVTSGQVPVPNDVLQEHLRLLEGMTKFAEGAQSLGEDMIHPYIAPS